MKICAGVSVSGDIIKDPNIAMHICNPSPEEAEAGELQPVQDRLV